MSKNATYVDEYEGFYFSSSYDLKKFKPLLIKHFKSGGGSQAVVLAGVCGVTKGTVWRWLDRADENNYKQEFAILIDELEASAAKAIDDTHLLAAKGYIKDSKAVERRFISQVEKTHKLNLSTETVAAMNSEDLKATLTCLRKDLTRNRITLSQFETLSKSLIGSGESDVAQFKKDFEELKSKL